MAKRRKKKIKIVLIILLILVLILLALFGFLYIKEKNKIKVQLINDLTLEINSEVKLNELVENIENGTLSNGEEYIDTTKLGEKNLTLKITKKDKVEEYSFKVTIVDTQNPVIDVDSKISAYTGTNLDLVSLAIVTDNSNEELEASVEGEYDMNKEGKYTIKFTAKDSSGNSTTQDVTLTVKKDPNNYTFETSKGFKGEVKDGITYIDGVLIANKTYALPSSYGDGLLSSLTKAFKKMDAAASKEGLNIWIQSGFRSYSTQKSIYNSYVAEDGKALADTYSARPGHSEHQTGLAIDLNTITDAFANTAEGKWVNENCHKYGFILRYPKGKQEITGYKYESWHLRYVGVELATKLYNDGDWITLEEYFGITSEYQ